MKTFLVILCALAGGGAAVVSLFDPKFLLRTAARAVPSRLLEERRPPVASPFPRAQEQQKPLERLNPLSGESGLDFFRGAGTGADVGAGASGAANPGPARAEGKGPAADSGERALSGQEYSLLEAAAGKWNDATAYALGAERGALFRLGKALLRYPRLVGFVLNNDRVVHGFMSQERVRRNCRDEQALIGYLTDVGNPTGISAGTKTFAASLQTPGATSTIFGSKLVKTVLEQCSAIQGVVRAPAAVAQIAMTNKDMLSLMMNPALVAALAANPEAMKTLNSAQASLGAPGNSSIGQIPPASR